MNNKEGLENALVGFISALLIFGIVAVIKADAQEKQWLKQGIKKYPECATARCPNTCIRLMTLAEEE